LSLRGSEVLKQEEEVVEAVPVRAQHTLGIG
jgi:hypothetical protein